MKIKKIGIPTNHWVKSIVGACSQSSNKLGHACRSVKSVVKYEFVHNSQVEIKAIGIDEIQYAKGSHFLHTVKEGRNSIQCGAVP